MFPPPPAPPHKKTMIMKKSILLLVFAIMALGYQSNAQEAATNYGDEVHIGLKLGFNYSNVYDSEGEDFNADPKFGLATGIFFSIPLVKYIGIQPEILFSQKGFRATGKLLGSTYEFTRTTNYIDVPLLFALKPSDFLTIFAGPQYSYLIKQKDVFANGSTSIEQEQEFEDANIRKNSLGFTGGLDINLEQIVLSARAGWDIQNNNGDGTTTTPRYKNVWYQASIGYRF